MSETSCRRLSDRLVIATHRGGHIAFTETSPALAGREQRPSPPSASRWIMPVSEDGTTIAARSDPANNDIREQPGRPGIPRAHVQGHPAQVLVDLAKEADLFAVGSRGRGRFEGLVLRSVSQHPSSRA
jgi:nucleotide-binding universal stress UspA family protein